MTKRKSKEVAPVVAADMRPQPSAVPADAPVTVTFSRDHRHGGVQYFLGQTLVVSSTTRDLLRQRDAIGGA